eukprot:7378648-Prymnesium_polylepis.1
MAIGVEIRQRPKMGCMPKFNKALYQVSRATPAAPATPVLTVGGWVHACLRRPGSRSPALGVPASCRKARATTIAAAWIDDVDRSHRRQPHPHVKRGLRQDDVAALAAERELLHIGRLHLGEAGIAARLLVQPMLVPPAGHVGEEQQWLHHLAPLTQRCQRGGVPLGRHVVPFEIPALTHARTRRPLHARVHPLAGDGATGCEARDVGPAQQGQESRRARLHRAGKVAKGAAEEALVPVRAAVRGGRAFGAQRHQTAAHLVSDKLWHRPVSRSCKPLRRRLACSRERAV